MSFPLERYLNVRMAYAPSWKHDGSGVAFLTNITGLPQSWLVDRAGGWPNQLTFRSDRVSFQAYSPVSSALVFGEDAGGNERTQFFLLEEGRVEVPLVYQPDAFHIWGDWSPDGGAIAYAGNDRDPRFYDVYLLDMESRQTHRVWESDETHFPLSFFPDGRYLLTTRRNTNLNNDLFLLDLERGERYLLTPHDGEALYTWPYFAPDGRFLYLLSNQGREFMAVMRLDLGNNQWHIHAARQADADVLALSKDGRWLAYAFNVDGRSELVVEDLKRGAQVEVVGLPIGVIMELVFHPHASYLAITHTGPRHTHDIWLMNLRTGECGPLTHSSLAGIPRNHFVEPQRVRYASFDGLEIPAFLYLPPKSNTGKRPPVLVYVHGGPESQYRDTFNPLIQYLVAQGYAVFAPNVRGSWGYGKTYVHLDDVEKRKDAVADLKWGVLWLRQSGQVDGKRVGIMGGSYGGYMVLAALATYPDLWAVGVDIVGIANLVTFLENTAPWRRHLREAEYGHLERDRAILAALSPINRVDRIRTPLMVIHGANDPRVPVGEAEQIVAALDARGVPVEYLRYEDEGHGLVRLKNKLDAYPRVVRFLNRWLGGKRPV